MKNEFFLVKEENGFIHKIFSDLQDAEKYTERLSKETGFDCFEIEPLNLPKIENEEVYF